MPSTLIAQVSRGLSRTIASTLDSSASTPPSPRWSKRSITVTYFSETMIVTAQKIIDSTGKIFSAVSGRPCGCAKASLNA